MCGDSLSDLPERERKKVCTNDSAIKLEDGVPVPEM